MDEQIAEHFSAGPMRRDVKALRATLESLTPGETVRVVLRTPRHGLYIVEGAVRTGVGGQLMVADVFLTPSGEIQRVDRGGALGELPSTSASVGTATDHAHGDLVRVRFSSAPHGVFDMYGALTAGRDRFLLVGGWIVFDGELVSPRVVGIVKLAHMDPHPVNLPSIRSVLEVGSAAGPAGDSAGS